MHSLISLLVKPEPIPEHPMRRVTLRMKRYIEPVRRSFLVNLFMRSRELGVYKTIEPELCTSNSREADTQILEQNSGSSMFQVRIVCFLHPVLHLFGDLNRKISRPSCAPHVHPAILDFSSRLRGLDISVERNSFQMEQLFKRG